MVTVLLSFVFGLAGASFLAETQPDSAALLDAGAAAVGLSGELNCAASMTIVLAAALLFTWLMHKLEPVFVFAVAGVFALLGGLLFCSKSGGTLYGATILDMA